MNLINSVSNHYQNQKSIKLLDFNCYSSNVIVLT